MKPYEKRFLDECGHEGLKIIAAYEDAFGIDYHDRYASWFGDLNMYEFSERKEISCEQLKARYSQSLKLLGIVPDQVKGVCREFLTDQLTRHIQGEAKRLKAEPQTIPKPITAEKETFELTREMLSVDRDIQVDDLRQEILVAFETWFDVDKKFYLDIAWEEDTWVNFYGFYNPYCDTLRLEAEISRQHSNEFFDYIPTETETNLIKKKITVRIRELYDQTPTEFCESEQESGLQMGGPV